MIHIVFQQADVKLLREAMELDPSLEGEIFEIKDEWGVGPLKDLDTEEGWNARVEWWRTQMEGSPYDAELLTSTIDDRKTVLDIKAALEADENQEAWIWMGQNQHDVTGYYWLMPQLKAYQGRAMIIFLNNLPFINEKGQLFYPWAVHDILPKEAVKAKKLARPITLSEFEIDPDEWKRLSDESAMVRILEGGKKIVGREENFYDNEILKNITNEWQKASRVLSNTLHRMKIKTGDLYLMQRLKHLVNEGRVELTGDMKKGWKDFDVKMAGVVKKEEVGSEEMSSGGE